MEILVGVGLIVLVIVFVYILTIEKKRSHDNMSIFIEKVKGELADLDKSISKLEEVLGKNKDEEKI